MMPGMNLRWLVLAIAMGCSKSSAPPDPPPKAEPTAPAAKPEPGSGAPSDQAAAANNAGKELMFSGHYAEASAKFRDAVARDPQPQYSFNLCTGLFQEGKFGEALAACNAVKTMHPSDQIATKTDALIAKIRDEAKRQNITLP
jgi:tetratricopeptide (TPR) repeat protein